MKKVSLLLVLIASFAFLFSCHKMEGDDIPSVDSKITEYKLDSTGVLKLTTTSEHDMIINMLKIYYVSRDSVEFIGNQSDSVVLNNVAVKQGNGIETIVDTIWKLAPASSYLYVVAVGGLGQSEPVIDTIKTGTDTITPFKVVTTMNPVRPQVTVGNAYLKNDTLWLNGSVTSYWRALMNKDGLTTALKFNWGVTSSSLDNEYVGVIDAIQNQAGNMTIDFKKGIPMKALQGVVEVWYQAYAKHAWGDGENFSEIKSISLSTK